VLSGSLEKAVKSNRISFNAAHGLDLPPISQGAKRYLTAEQVRDLADTVDTIGHGKELGYGLAIYVLSYCGLRWSELSGLRVKDINFRRARLEVQHTITETEGVQVEGVPKSYEARSIGVPATVLEGLRAQVAGKSPDAPVFSGARGGWLRNRVFRRGWLTAAAIAIDEEGLTPHELRHTAASLAISAGANVKAVQRMLGHASAAVTLDVYADLFEDDVDEVSAALDQTIHKASVSKTCPDEDSAQSSDLTM
jgi:integrase